MKRCPTSIVHCLLVRAEHNERLDGRCAVEGGREVQRRSPISSFGADVGVGIDKEPEDGLAARQRAGFSGDQSR